ncbi:uncharacterized protein LOC143194050 isoform X3 [Rhynchophorus ferrugineus]|uniref:uncharacterized protein LOC143194050 isoform X3 n=1 Tax=Rhynchophorus ferrugineus TaxID=354439 RepID=UPI003FCE2BF2
MLRTRRKDNNVKPNRRDSSFKSRLDRKSSRGMLYENEELRLKTININAEIERGQSDIKKLKRENEMLKKEIWCLRDEYDKLDKLLKDKKMDFSSSSTTYSSSSDSESCSSCTEESEEVETSQNIQNVQKTNLKNIRNQFDHLSIVTEETSCENSDKNSVNTRQSVNNDQTDSMMWNYDKDAIKPDQSYPAYEAIMQNRSQTLPSQANMNYFSPIQHSKSFDENQFNQVHHQQTIYPEEYYNQSMTCQNNMQLQSQTPPIAISPSPPHYENQQVVFANTNAENEHFYSKKIVHTNATNFYQNIVLGPKNPNSPVEVKSMEKKATDLIVKIDNQNFNKNLTYSNTTPSTTFSNGGNLEELLHDIESISQRGHHPSTNHPGNISPIHGTSTETHGQFYGVAISAQGQEMPYQQNPVLDRVVVESGESRQLTASQERLHRSELSVVLMPKAMPLIGFEKYKNIQRSFESLNSKHFDSPSASQQNLNATQPDAVEADVPANLHVNIPVSQATFPTENSPNYTAKTENQEHNPFFFGNLNDNYVNSDYFNRRYNPDTFIQDTPDAAVPPTPSIDGIKTDKSPHPDEPVTENEEDIKLKTSKPDGKDKEKKSDNDKKKDNQTKSPKLSITRKVSIHFKGKKEKEKLKKLAQENGTPEVKSNGSKTVQEGRKPSLFDFRSNNDSNKEKADVSTPKMKHKQFQKTPSIESRKSTTETLIAEAKTPTSLDGDKKTAERREKDSKRDDRKGRKSLSISPDRAKHVHMLPEAAGLKKHKKHRRERSGATRVHRASIDPRLRERSYSICTDRSMGGPSLALGAGYGSFLYDDYSDRERTNSGSSCESHDNQRKMSSISNVPLNGKVPWCGCWGNGCL